METRTANAVRVSAYPAKAVLIELLHRREEKAGSPACAAKTE